MMKLTGMDSLLKQIEGMARADQVKEKALEKGAEYMRQKVEQNTPVSALPKDHAKDHIIKEKTDEGYNIGPSSDYFYLQFKEWGTKNMPAEPFMQPTFDREISKVQELMTEEIKKELGL